METAETFYQPITDEYGGEFTEAVVAILDGYRYVRQGFHAEEVGAVIDFKTITDGLSYEVVYCYKKEFIGLKKFRQLRVLDDDGSFTKELKADLTTEESKAIIDSDYSENDKLDKLMKADLKRRFG